MAVRPWPTSASRAPASFSIDLFRRELVALREALDLREVHLIGQSWGCMLALEHVLSGAAGVRSLVLESGLASMDEWNRETLRLRSELPADVLAVLDAEQAAGRKDSEAFKAAYAVWERRHVLRMDDPPEWETLALGLFERDHRVYDVMTGGAEFPTGGAPAEFDRWDVRPRLGEVTVPTLLLSGRYDEATPAVMRSLARRHRRFGMAHPGGELAQLSLRRGHEDHGARRRFPRARRRRHRRRSRPGGMTMPVHSSLNSPAPQSQSAFTAIGVRIPMRDGLSLHAAVWRPRGHTEPVSAVMELTPYGIDHLNEDGVFWAAEGFAYVAIDVRGRGNSDGDFVPFLRDASDGYDAVEWIAAQDWCDGQVALHGGSYTGINQYLILAAAPPSLKAITPDSTTGHGIDLPRGGIPMLYDFGWRRLVSNRGTQFTIAGDIAHWHRHLYDAAVAGTSLVEAAVAAGAPFDEWVLEPVDHAEPGPRWEVYWAQPEQLAATTVPVLSITGMYDDSSGGTIHNWRRFVAARTCRGGGREPPRGGPVGPHGHALRRGQGGRAGLRAGGRR